MTEGDGTYITATVTRYQQSLWLNAVAAAVDHAGARLNGAALGPVLPATVRGSGVWLLCDNPPTGMTAGGDAVTFYSGSTALYTVSVDPSDPLGVYGLLALRWGPS